MNALAYRYFLSSLLAAGILCCGEVIANASEPDVVQQWLTNSCPDGESDSPPVGLTASSPNVVPELIDALQNGPDQQNRTQHEATLSGFYKERQAMLASDGLLGLSQNDISKLKSETEEHYINTELTADIYIYKARAVGGLLIARSPAGLLAIQEFARTTTDVDLKAVASNALLQAADVNHDAKVDCEDMALVKSSFGKKSGQQGFDMRADVNGDGVVDVGDLSFVARQLSAGTKCQ